jgi:hypothetical protein
LSLKKRKQQQPDPSVMGVFVKRLADKGAKQNYCEPYGFQHPSTITL